MPSQSSRLYRRIADQLRAAIANGDYAKGEKLPGERELAEAFGVSRPTIREAMIALEIYGVVEIRHGAGIFVIETEAAVLPGADTATGGLEDLNVGAFELLEARIIIEGGAAAVAATAVTDENIARLEALLGRMKAGTPDECDEADREFHMEMCRATNNGPLIDAIENLWELRTRSLLASTIEARARGSGYAARIEEHTQILDALRARDPAAARKAMQWHLERVRDHFLVSTETEEMETLRNKQKAARAALVRRLDF